ncbi:hypothetical protein T484DRAFT_1902079 [Baffinella frigidus]|nr:hypothetical protein T484DRAFT_1902079 [Cryptophyta sp. CCMP2293]
MSIFKLRLGLNPFTLLLSVFIGLVCVCSYFYILSFLLQAGDPDADSRRRLLMTKQDRLMITKTSLSSTLPEMNRLSLIQGYLDYKKT